LSARGVLQIHSAPPALCPHVEWAVAGVLGVPVSLPWVDQPASPGSLRTELDWQGRPGASGAITSALSVWGRLRFEITEEPSPGCDAVRYSCTPALGTFSATVSANGDVLIPEGRLRAAMALAASSRSLPGRPGPGDEEPGELAGLDPAGADDDLARAAARRQPGGEPGTVRELREVRDLRDLRERHAPRHPALGGSLEAELSLLLGQPWDDEREPFRYAGAGAPVRWLHATG
jgi:uncharacterized protein DUF3145